MAYRTKGKENIFYTRILYQSAINMTFDPKTWFKVIALPLPTGTLLVKWARLGQGEKKIWLDMNFTETGFDLYLWLKNLVQSHAIPFIHKHSSCGLWAWQGHRRRYMELVKDFTKWCAIILIIDQETRSTLYPKAPCVWSMNQFGPGERI